MHKKFGHLDTVPPSHRDNSMTGWFKKRLLGNDSVAECRAKRGVSRQPTSYESGHLDTRLPAILRLRSGRRSMTGWFKKRLHR